MVFVAALGLSLILTLSHALLRAAAVFSPFEVSWMLRVGPALLLYGLVFFVYTALLRYFDISLLYPMYTALSVIGVSVIGIVYYDEALSGFKIVGALLLIVGIWLISS